MCSKVKNIISGYFNIVFFLIFIIMFNTLIYAQTYIEYYTLYTPEGKSFIAGAERPELNAGEKASLDSMVQKDFIEEFGLNAVKIGDASRAYNCHGYAWSVSEGGLEVVITVPTMIYCEDEAYSNDGLPSYISASETEATHSYYWDVNHSARKIQNSYPIPISGGRDYVSKWGRCGIYAHAKYHDPYCRTAPEDMYFYKLKTTHSGTLSGNQKTWIGAGGITHTVTNSSENSVTIPAGGSLTVQPGATINFSNNSKLTVNGTLTANGGSSTTPITFNFISPNSSTQNGIVFNSGSSGIINYGIVRNAYRGIYENGVSIDIINSAFSNCTDGIYLYSSSPWIESCNIHHNSNAGVNMLYSSSYTMLKDNYIQNNSVGIFCSTNSQPVIGYNSTQIGNYISSNSYGIIVANNAIPVIGNSSSGGYNNLLNTTNNILNTTANTIYAQNNWWGSTNPANFLISGGPVSYTPYCTTQVTIQTPQLSKANENIASIDDEIPMLSELEKAYQLVDSKNYIEAREICLNLVNNYPDYSVSFNALNLLKETYSENELSAKKNIFESLSGNKSRKDLYAIAGVLLSDIDKENKIKHLDDVLNSYKEGAAAELAMFNKFVYYYFEVDDLKNARAVSKQIDENFSKSNVSIEAHKILGDEEYFGQYPVDRMNADNQQSLKKEVAEVPKEFMLYDNYPNPFNPATVIKYAIPQNSKVVLEVYSTLGEKVATLVNEAKSAGYYETKFDGSNLSSGIYIYRLTANSLESGKQFVKAGKMMLVK